MHLDMNKDLLRINNYMQVLLITPKPPVSILNENILCIAVPSLTCGSIYKSSGIL